MSNAVPSMGDQYWLNVYDSDCPGVGAGVRLAFPNKETADLYASRSELRRVACIGVAVNVILLEDEGGADDQASAGKVEQGHPKAALHAVSKVRRACAALSKERMQGGKE